MSNYRHGSSFQVIAEILCDVNSFLKRHGIHAEVQGVTLKPDQPPWVYLNYQKKLDRLPNVLDWGEHPEGGRRRQLRLRGVYLRWRAPETDEPCRVRNAHPTLPATSPVEPRPSCSIFDFFRSLP